MTLPISLKISTDAATGLPAKGDVKGAQTAGKALENGFAALISRLSAEDGKPGDQAASLKASAAALASGAAKTGKILPVGEQELADGAEKDGSDSAEKDGQSNVSKAADATALIVPLVLPAGIATTPVTDAVAKPNETNAAERTDKAAATASRLGPATAGSAPRKATSAAPAEVTETTRMVAKPEAAEIAKVSLVAAAVKRAAEPVEKPARAAADTASMAASTAIAKPQAQPARPAGLTVSIAAADKAIAHGMADGRTSGEGSDNGESGADRPLPGVRNPGADQPTRLFDLGASSSIAARPVQAHAGQPASAQTVPAQTAMSAEGIAHFVERLSLARDFDMTQSASLVVKHQDFGPLTVTFDHARSGLDVQVAAQDAETQRALASAMASDRNLVRPGDGHNAVQASHASAGGGERNAASSGQQAFASAGGGHAGDRSAGQSAGQSSGQPYGQSSQQGSRPGSQRQTHHRSPARPTTDDGALYA